MLCAAGILGVIDMFGSFIQSMIDIFKLVGEAFGGFISEIKSFNKEDGKKFFTEIKKPENRKNLLYFVFPLVLFFVGLFFILFFRI